MVDTAHVFTSTTVSFVDGNVEQLQLAVLGVGVVILDIDTAAAGCLRGSILGGHLRNGHTALCGTPNGFLPNS
jgi:hypothetical protein